MKRKLQKVAIGFLGTELDKKSNEWRPTLCLCSQENLHFNRIEIFFEKKFESIFKELKEDINKISPETQVNPIILKINDPWDFEEVYSTLFDFSKNYKFNADEEEYYIHITTGTHTAQICLFLLVESRHIPGVLIQTAPQGTCRIIDLNLERYNLIASRFNREKYRGVDFLKSGIKTRNREFNDLIEKIEKVSRLSNSPILILGPTGSGKTLLARRIYELKKYNHIVSGGFVEVNCATIRGEGAMSALFGHVKGAYTGAIKDRDGLLRIANKGIILLDEIGELGLDEQAMLLRAIEEKKFFPVGSDREVESDFQLIAATSRDLQQAVQEGRFREDLFARIKTWTFKLPPLRERPEDIEPNMDYELEKYEEATGKNITMSREAREMFLKFAISKEAKWSANFRDLGSAMVRMATLAEVEGGRITEKTVEEEIKRLKEEWKTELGDDSEKQKKLNKLLENLLGPGKLASLDPIEKVQLEYVLDVCRKHHTISEAGREIYSASRKKKKSQNDADRLKKYLLRYSITWEDIHKKI